MTIDKNFILNGTLTILLAGLIGWGGYTLYEDHQLLKATVSWVSGVIAAQQQQQAVQQRQVEQPKK